jgi:hypothetical protein
MHKEPNFLYLMLGMLFGVVLITSTSPFSSLSFLVILFAALSLMVTAYILTERRRELLLAVVLGASALVPFAWFSIHRGELGTRLAQAIYSANLAFWLLFTLYVGLMVFRRLMTARRIGGNEIYGAIYVYLLIGVLFAEVYQLLLAWRPYALYFDPGRFGAPHLIAGSLYTRGAGEVVYYSFVTLATVGYGDVTPSSPLARSVSLVEAVVGIMYVATMIARFVSIHTSREKRGAEREEL